MWFDLFYELASPAQAGRSESRLYEETLEEIALADRLGFNGVWLVEHHFSGEYSHSTAPEVFLAAASQRTKAIRLGHGVVVLPYHHPIHVAEWIATLDVLSGGRVELGIGRGFSVEEYAAFGIAMQDSRAHVEESLAILRQALRRTVHHSGRRFRFAGVDVTPKPIQAPHPPLWTAAVSPETFTWAAREGIGVLAGPFKPWFLVRRDLGAYRRAWRDAHGADAPSPGQNSRFGVTVGVLCLEDGDEARRLGADAFVWFYRRLLEQTRPILEALERTYEYYRTLGRLRFLMQRALSLRILDAMGMVVVGDPDECTRKLTRLAQAGVDHVLCAVGAGVLPTEIVQRSLHVMAERVLPRFCGETRLQVSQSR